jgi:hypothetical protein
MTFLMPFQLPNLPVTTKELIEERRLEFLDSVPPSFRALYENLKLLPHDRVINKFGSEGKVVSIRNYLSSQSARNGIRFMDYSDVVIWLPDNDLEVVYRPSHRLLTSLYGDENEE